MLTSAIGKLIFWSWQTWSSSRVKNAAAAWGPALPPPYCLPAARTSALCASAAARWSSCVWVAPLHLWRLPNAAMVVTSTPLDTGAVAAAYNAAHTRLAVFDLAGRLTIWQREGASKSWALGSSLAADGLRITSLCWAPVEFGGVIAGGAADGSVAVWQEAAGEGAWRLAALLKEGTLAVQDVAFAPPELGPLLAAAYADGFVR